jgi:hypothetical protein
MSFRYDKSEMTVELKDSYFGAGLVKIEGSEHRVREALDYINQILVPSTDFSSRFRNIKTEFLYVIISFIVILTSFALCILNRPIDSLDVFILAIIGVLSLVPLGLIDDLRDRWATKIVFNWGEGEKIYKRGIRNVRFMIFILPLWVISTVIIPILLK